MKKKDCRICWERKPLEEFHQTKDPAYKDGRLNWCKDCQSAYNRHRRDVMRKKLHMIDDSAGFVMKFE